VQLYSLG